MDVSSMELIRCPKCDEMYSPTYDECPFCAEDGDAGSQKPHKPRRRVLTKQKAQSARGAMIAALALVLALLSVYLFGGKLIRFGVRADNHEDTAQDSGGEAGRQPQSGESAGGSGASGGGAAGDAETTEPVQAEEPPVETADVSNASLNRSDFTLSYAGEKFTIKLSGTEAKPTWSIDNANVASITADGTVTAVANGNTQVHCKVGARDLACTVRVRNTGRDAAPASAPTVAESVEPAAPSVPGTVEPSVPKTSDSDSSAAKPSETTPAGTKPAASGSAQHVDASSLSVKTNYGTKLQKDPGSGYPDCTVRIGGDPISLVISGTDVPVSSWTSDKTSVVEVSETGRLKPVSQGTAHVTAVVGDAEITCIIRVR